MTQKPPLDRPPFTAAPDRYEGMAYRRSGRSGLKLPVLSLGFWHNFGGADSLENGRAIVRRAFDLGITHFDLANNYGPPPGSAEETMGYILKNDLSVVLVDDLQYLISCNTFEGAVRFIRNLVDKISERSAVFLLSVDPNSLNPQERSILERELRVVRDR